MKHHGPLYVLSENLLFWWNVMFVGTMSRLVWAPDGSLPYSENTPLYPQSCASVQSFPRAAGVK